jgi:hypothetical protein
MITGIAVRARSALALGVAAGLALLTSAALAQAPSPYAVETNMPGVYAFGSAPPGFDRTTASPQALAELGYPQRPGPDAPAAAMERWLKLTDPGVQRIVPTLVKTNIYHRPATGLRIDKTTGATTSENWSGVALVQNSPAFVAVEAGWIVPAVRQPPGKCSGTDYSSQWVGIDGFSNPHLFQAGSEADVSCFGGKSTESYDPWIEWLPAAEVVLTNKGKALPFAAGDYVIVLCTATNFTNGRSKTGTLLFEDVTQNWQLSLSTTAAALGGKYVVGQSAEWIVERTEVGSSFATLPDYHADPWFLPTAKDSNGTGYTVTDSGGAQEYTITMTDNNGKNVSYVDIFANGNNDALWFFPEGSATK